MHESVPVAGLSENKFPVYRKVCAVTLGIFKIMKINLDISPKHISTQLARLFSSYDKPKQEKIKTVDKAQLLCHLAVYLLPL